MSAWQDDRIRLTVPSHGKHLPLVRAVVQEAAELAGFDGTQTHRVLLAVTEAISNVIRHAYGERPDERIDLEMRPGRDTLRLDLIDYGEFVDPKHIASRPLDDVRPGGIGVHLIKATMDSVAYRRNEHGGTTLTMVKHVAAEKAASREDPS